MKNMIFRLCGVIYCLFGVVAFVLAGPQDSIWKHEVIEVNINVDGWVFFVGAEGEIGLPTEAYLKVFAEKGDKMVRISSPKDIELLDGISIENERQALSWVRFFTRRDLFRYFDSPRAIEIEVDNSKVIQISDGFCIERMLAFEPDATDDRVPIYRVKEKVLRNGKYLILEKEFIMNRNRVELQIPVIE